MRNAEKPMFRHDPAVDPRGLGMGSANPSTLTAMLATLPAGRRRVAEALIGNGGRTYPAVAATLGIHLGTVHQHLRRIRLLHPEVYAALTRARARQLAQRHRQAVARA